MILKQQRTRRGTRKVKQIS